MTTESRDVHDGEVGDDAWSLIIVGAPHGLADVAGPWVPGAIIAVSGLSAGCTAIARGRAGRTVDTPPDPPPWLLPQAPYSALGLREFMDKRSRA